MATLHGKNSIVYLQGSGADAVEISEATDFNIDADFDTDEDSALGDTWKTSVKGMSSWGGTLNGNYDTASTVAWDAFVATTARKIYLYPDRSSATQYYYGTCWPKLSVKPGDRAGRATYSGSVEGVGQLAYN